MISIIRNGVTTAIESTIKLIGHDGWGMAPLHLLTSRGPLQDGESYENFRLDGRDGILVFRVPENSLDDMYTIRATVENLFAPNMKLSLLFAMSYGNRQIDGYISKLLMPWTVKEWAAQKLTVNVYCPDPTFYDPAAQATTYNLGGGAGSFVVPTPVPTEIGASTIDQTNTITNTGNWRDYPVIRIVGPITDCKITNNTTGEKIDLTGATVAAGDYYDIDCRYGYKTVKDSAAANQIGDLTDDSDLATFHIAGTDEVTDGINSINVTGSNVTEATNITITYYKRYLGI